MEAKYYKYYSYKGRSVWREKRYTTLGNSYMIHTFASVWLFIIGIRIVYEAEKHDKLTT
jgi:hypothetical protein